jgi:hypothetical protein
VKSLLDINLLDAAGGKLIDSLTSDPVMLVDVLYALCKPDADAAGVSDVQFGEAMAGDAIDLATTAMLEELADFFPKARDRARARRVLGMIGRLVDKAQDILDAKVTATEPQIEKLMTESVERSFLPSATDWPASAASIPAR